MKKITKGSLKGGTGCTTMTYCLALELGRRNPSKKILVVTTINFARYMFDLQGQERETLRGNKYNRYALENIAFCTYGQRMSAIDLEKPDILITDLGIVLKHYPIKPGEKLYYCYPTGDSLIEQIETSRDTSNGTVIKYPIALLNTIQGALTELPLQSMQEAITLGQTTKAYL